MRHLPLLAAALGAAAGALTNVVIETDVGTAIDDTFAVPAIMGAPNVNVQLLVVSTFNTTLRAKIMAKQLAQMQRLDVPIAVAEPQPGEPWIPLTPYVDDFDLERDWVGQGGKLFWGVEEFYRLAAAASAEQPLYVLQLAPPVALAEVLRMDASIASKMAVVAMSGSVRRGYPNNQSEPCPEFNVVADIEAAQLMYNASWARPLITAPLDSGDFAQMLGTTYFQLMDSRTAGNQGAEAVYQQSVAWASNLGPISSWFVCADGEVGCIPWSLHNGTCSLYDAEASFILARIAASPAPLPANACPAWLNSVLLPLTVEPLRLAVNASGFTVPSADGQLVCAATGWQQGLGAAAASGAVGAVPAWPWPWDVAQMMGNTLVRLIADSAPSHKSA